ncbi:MAG: lytic transglycosylase domain-containing protein, partial [Treponema sp.]|nr:lytic transglycosylase domain-containing protein [Treponema sp.]
RDAAALELILPVLENNFPAGRITKRRPVRSSGFSAAELTLRAAACYARGTESPALYGEAERLCAAAAALPDFQGAFSGISRWNKALSLMAGLRLMEASVLSGSHPSDGSPSGGSRQALPDLRTGAFSFLTEIAPSAAARWFLMEVNSLSFSLFGEAERAAVNGHDAAARFSFAEGLEFFRTVMEEGNTLFFQYPDLINDLGRCFQFAAAGEGMELFLEWERSTENRNVRYRLLFFAARMAHWRGAAEKGTELFTRALVLAPDSLQKDACMWYILDIALSDEKNVKKAAASVKEMIPAFGDDSYFSDILERLARLLTERRLWQDLAEVYALVEPRSNSLSAAQYAWILGRAVEEGYFTDETAGDRASMYFRGAYRRAGTGGDALYYRMKSAAALGEPFLNPGKAGAGTFLRPELMEFLLGFFRSGAGDLSFSYVDEKAGDLSTAELRTLARAMHDDGLYAGAIRLVSVYMNRDNYELVREDLELAYPRPWRRWIGEKAEENGFEPELLFGLIRTESAFQPGIVSRAGAVGLTQLMAATAEEVAGRLKRQGGPDHTENGGPDLLDPEVNIHLGAVYLRYLAERLEDPLFALIAYNGGLTRFRRWRAAEPDLPGDLFLETVAYSETRTYARRVLSAAAVYRLLYGGPEKSPAGSP